MEPGMELEFVAGVRRYASLPAAADLNSFSAYAGTDFKQHVDDALSYVWHIRYGVKITFKTAVRSEIKPSKQKFLQQQFGKDFLLCSDTKDMLGDSIVDLNSGAATNPSWVHSMHGGFPCTSRTPLSSKARDNVDCVQRDTAATGVGANTLLRIVDKWAPEEVIIECVVTLKQKTGKATMSDADFITQSLQKLGYWAGNYPIS